MTKITLLSALTALLILPSIASAESTADFDATTNATWLRVLTLAKISDGESSREQQTMMINITALPEGGAKSRAVRSLANPTEYYFQPSPFKTLVIGQNNVSIVAADYNRAVKVQFDSDAIEYDALTINGVDQLATTPAEGTQGQVDSQTISESTDIFDTTTNATWVRSATLVLNSQGPAVSSLEQTLVMDVTYIPAGGANYRVYKTLDGGGGDFGAAQALALDENTITVPAVSYNRSVKIQFDNVGVEFDALSINGDAQTTLPAEGTQGVGDPISDFPNVIPANFDGSWYAATMATLDDGAASQAEQTAVINVTYIPEGGATWRSNSTNAAGNFIAANEGPLAVGPNTITVAAVDFDRKVNVQFSSNAIEFDALTLNNENPLIGEGTPGVGQSISESTDIFAATGASAQGDGWWSVTTMTTTGAGAPGQDAQTLEINVTYIPAGGAQMRGWSQGENGGGTFYDGQQLTFGINTIIVPATVGWADPEQGRATKIQFSSDAIEFDVLTFNGVNQLSVDDSGDTVTIANSNLFNAGPDATWVAVLTTAVSQDGASSRSQQTVVLNVTYLPGGANYRVVKTVADGTWDTGDSQLLGLGANTITVNSVGFDRSVKIEFSSDAVEYDALSVNDAARVIGADAVAVPSVSINGSTLTWTQADGTTLQFSDDLESWTSLPSAASPYSPSTTPDRFYRTISEEAE